MHGSYSTNSTAVRVRRLGTFTRVLCLRSGVICINPEQGHANSCHLVLIYVRMKRCLSRTVGIALCAGNPLRSAHLHAETVLHSFKPPHNALREASRARGFAQHCLHTPPNWRGRAMNT